MSLGDLLLTCETVNIKWLKSTGVATAFITRLYGGLSLLPPRQEKCLIPHLYSRDSACFQQHKHSPRSLVQPCNFFFMADKSFPQGARKRTPLFKFCCRRWGVFDCQRCRLRRSLGALLKLGCWLRRRRSSRCASILQLGDIRHLRTGTKTLHFSLPANFIFCCCFEEEKTVKEKSKLFKNSDLINLLTRTCLTPLLLLTFTFLTRKLLVDLFDKDDLAAHMQWVGFFQVTG